ERRRLATLLFCDLVGSTALGEAADPEAVRAVVSKYFDRARATIERHGGTVEKFAGDPVMAAFGGTTAHEDDALRACPAALEIVDEVSEFALRCRIGVSTGEVVTADGRDTFVTGDAVNVAARLEQAAAPGEVLLETATFALVRQAVDAEAVPAVEAKGKSAPGARG